MFGRRDNFEEPSWFLCLLIMGFVMLICGGVSSMFVQKEFPYKGECTVVKWMDPTITGKDYYQGGWCVNYKSESNDPLVENTPTTLNCRKGWYLQKGSDPFCIRMDDRYQLEEYHQLMEEHPVNSSSTCYMTRCHQGIDKFNDRDIYSAENVVWSYKKPKPVALVLMIVSFSLVGCLCLIISLFMIGCWEFVNDQEPTERSPMVVKSFEEKSKSVNGQNYPPNLAV